MNKKKLYKRPSIVVGDVEINAICLDNLSVRKEEVDDLGTKDLNEEEEAAAEENIHTGLW